MVYHGPVIAAKIRKELAILVKKEGLENLQQAVGLDHR